MQPLKTHLFQAIEAINDRIITIRQDLHAHPELSAHEKHTTYLIKGIMEVEDQEVREFQESYGLIAEPLNSPGEPFIALRADVDLLPIEEHTDLSYALKEKGVMHACGHDSHTAILLGSAIALSQIRTEVPGNIRFIFEPAEEITEGGSSQMIKKGAPEDVKAIFGLHAYPYLRTGQIGYKYGVMLASTDTFKIKVDDDALIYGMKVIAATALKAIIDA